MNEQPKKQPQPFVPHKPDLDEPPGPVEPVLPDQDEDPDLVPDEEEPLRPAPDGPAAPGEGP